MLLLTNTNQILEIQTSLAGSVDYEAAYADHTSTTFVPNSSQGNIVGAATTTIVTAPAASTQRQIKFLSIRNKGTATQVITLKKDVAGTEYIIIAVSLQSNETLFYIEGGGFLVLDVSGRVKTQNTGDSEITGDVRSIYKIGTAPEAAGQFYSFAKDSGFPGAWSPGTPGINGRNTDGTTAADAGCINMGNPASGSWYLRDVNMSASVAGQFNVYDILWVNSGLVVTTTTAQAITQPTLPPRDNNSSTDGLGIYVGLLVTTATTNGAAITNMTLSYTNSDGVAGRTATIASFPATAVIGTFVIFQLQAGDKGVRSIQSVTFGTSLVAGAVSLFCFNPLASASIVLANSGSLAYPKKLDLKLNNGHCLLPLWLASGTGAVNLNGNLYFVNK